MNRRGTLKLEAKDGQFQCPLYDPSRCVWIVQYPLQREASDDNDFVRLEVVKRLTRGHKKAEEQFLHTGVPRSCPLQEATNQVVSAALVVQREIDDEVIAATEPDATDAETTQPIEVPPKKKMM